jgi:hypothetical protein
VETIALQVPLYEIMLMAYPDVTMAERIVARGQHGAVQTKQYELGNQWISLMNWEISRLPCTGLGRP